jgi:hypothetical protein
MHQGVRSENIRYIRNIGPRVCVITWSTVTHSIIRSSGSLAWLAKKCMQPDGRGTATLELVRLHHVTVPNLQR